MFQSVQQCSAELVPMSVNSPYQKHSYQCANLPNGFYLIPSPTNGTMEYDTFYQHTFASTMPMKSLEIYMEQCIQSMITSLGQILHQAVETMKGQA
jgi:hypothetical protein